MNIYTIQFYCKKRLWYFSCLRYIEDSDKDSANDFIMNNKKRWTFDSECTYLSNDSIFDVFIRYVFVTPIIICDWSMFYNDFPYRAYYMQLKGSERILTLYDTWIGNQYSETTWNNIESWKYDVNVTLHQISLVNMNR